MDKSLGNVFVLKDLESEGISNGPSLRYLYLQSHYRRKVNVTPKSLAAGKNGYENLIRQVVALKQAANLNANLKSNAPQKNRASLSTPDPSLIEKFKAALDEDLNTPQAMAVLQQVFGSELNPEQKIATILKMDEVLGLNLENAEHAGTKEITNLPAEIAELLEKRKTAKQQKDYALSDMLRKKIESMGYILEDTATETKVYKN